MGGLILLVIPGIIFSVWFSFSAYINLLESTNNKGSAALSASKKLVVGRWWPVFVRLIVPALVIYLVLIVVMIIVGIITTLLTGVLSEYDKMMIVNLISSVVSVAITPLIIMFGIILYNSLKATMQAPITPPAQTSQQ